jgi:hypothetical protein
MKGLGIFLEGQKNRIKSQSGQLVSQLKFEPDPDWIEVLQLFSPPNHFKIHGRQNFTSALGKDDKHAATNFTDMIAITTVTKLYAK